MSERTTRLAVEPRGAAAAGPGVPDDTAPLRERWFVPYALLPHGLAKDVSLEVAEGRYVWVRPGTSSEGADRVFTGVALAGFANAHSHAFHRALRGRTHAVTGTFSTWRETMYDLAARLNPESYYALARAIYVEMVQAGITTVGEFHYLHHGEFGRRYSYPNAMSNALTRAAEDAGLRITLLDSLYLSGGLTASGHSRLDSLQARFSDQVADDWARRVARHRESEDVRVGLAVHSVRAVPRSWLQFVRDVSVDGPHARARGRTLPVHAHVSEQPEENEACLAYYGCTPTELLHDAGLVGPTFTAVHATHLTEKDVALLGRARATVALCPTTERDVGAGIGPARLLHDAGARLALGTDQHVVVDMFEEARALEMHERLVSGERGRLGMRALQSAMTAHDSLGWEDTGALRAGARADLVVVDLDSPRTAGVLPDQVVMAATATDITHVAVNGNFVVRDGMHRLGPPGDLVREALATVWS